MALACPMVGNGYGPHIVWNTFVVKTARWMEMMCSARSAESLR